jgi:DNA-binding response OmpR family regulator
MKKILIVEDDVNINNLLKEALSQKGYTCGQAFSGTEAALWLEKESWMLVLLDLMLPGMTGEEVLQLIRRQGDTPVIVLTAKDAMEEKLDLLTSGADDYITKPFDINEVIARVQIQLRHAGQEAEPDRIECGGIMLDDKTHQIWVDGQEILHLTRQEYAILELLIRHPKQVFRKEAIFTYAWEEEYMGETKTLDVHISNIRKKLKAVTDKEYIQTVWGIGYRLNQ